MTQAKYKNEIPIAVAERGVEVRGDQMGDLLVAFERWPKGDWKPLFHGLPGNACQAPHWGYVIKGAGRLTTKDGVTELRAGQAYYAPPGHTFEVLEDAEFVEFTIPHPEYEAHVGVMMKNFETMGQKAAASAPR